MKKRRITKTYFDHFLKRFDSVLWDITRRYTTKNCDININFGIAVESLMYIMIHFDDKKFPQTGKGSFNTFLYARSRGKINHEIKRNKAHSHVELHDGIEGEITNTEIPLLLEELILRLNSREQIVVRGLCANKTVLETASDAGISSGSVYQVRQMALAKIKRMIEA